MTDSMLGSFEEQVLLAVLRVESAYGMEVRREIERLTERDVAIGAVYSTLDRLEAKGLVQSTRERVDGRSRRVFALEPPGVQALQSTRSMRDRLWRGVSLEPTVT